MNVRKIACTVLLMLASFTSVKAQGYDYVFSWWDPSTTTSFPVGYQYAPGPTAFGFGDIISLSNPGGMTIRGLDFLVDTVSSPRTPISGDFYLQLYEVNPGAGGDFQAPGASFGNMIAQFYFGNSPLVSDNQFQYFLLEGFSVQVPQHFGYAILNQSGFETSFTVPTTGFETPAVGVETAYSRSDYYWTYARGYIQGEGGQYWNPQIALAGTMVPEPPSFGLVGLGVTALMIARRRRYTRTIEPARARAAETLTLERTLSDLVNQAYALSPAEVELLWRTVPPRMPVLPTGPPHRPTEVCRQTTR
jgi:hypothetical protein